MIYILPSCFCTHFSFTSVEITDFVWLSPLAIFTESSEWAVFTVNLQSYVSFRILRFIYQTHNNKRFHSQWVFSRNSWQNSADRKNGEESQKLKNKLSFYFLHISTGPLTFGKTLKGRAVRVFGVFRLPPPAPRTNRISRFPISKRTEHADDFSQTEPRGKKIPHAVVRSLEVPNEPRTRPHGSRSLKGRRCLRCRFGATTPWRTREWLLCALRTRERKRERGPICISI